MQIELPVQDLLTSTCPFSPNLVHFICFQMMKGSSEQNWLWQIVHQNHRSLLPKSDRIEHPCSAIILALREFQKRQKIQLGFPEPHIDMNLFMFTWKSFSWIHNISIQSNVLTLYLVAKIYEHLVYILEKGWHCIETGVGMGSWSIPRNQLEREGGVRWAAGPDILAERVPGAK